MVNALIPKVVAWSCRDSNRSTWEHQSHNVHEPWQIPIKSKEIEVFPSKTFQNHYTEPRKLKETKRKPKKPLYRTKKTKYWGFGKLGVGSLHTAMDQAAILHDTSHPQTSIFWFFGFGIMVSLVLFWFLLVLLVRCNGFWRSLMKKLVFSKVLLVFPCIGLNSRWLKLPLASLSHKPTSWIIVWVSNMA